MRHAVTERDRARTAEARLRMIGHDDQVARNVTQTCQFFGLSRTQLSIWLRRYREAGVAAFRGYPFGCHRSPCSPGTKASGNTFPRNTNAPSGRTAPKRALRGAACQHFVREVAQALPFHPGSSRSPP
jgi:transposase-like protein